MPFNCRWPVLLASLLQIYFSLADCEFIFLRIDLDEFISLFDDLIVSHVDFRNTARNLRSNRHDVGLYAGIPSVGYILITQDMRKEEHHEYEHCDACPKLDSGQEIYLEKIKAWFDEARINTLTVLIMQVPCCTGLLNLAQQAAQAANRKVPIKHIVVGVQGEILQKEWAAV